METNQPDRAGRNSQFEKYCATAWKRGNFHLSN